MFFYIMSAVFCFLLFAASQAGGFAPNGTYLKWLEADLSAAAANRAQRPWIITGGYTLMHTHAHARVYVYTCAYIYSRTHTDTCT